MNRSPRQPRQCRTYVNSTPNQNNFTSTWSRPTRRTSPSDRDSNLDDDGYGIFMMIQFVQRLPWVAIDLTCMVCSWYQARQAQTAFGCCFQQCNNNNYQEKEGMLGKYEHFCKQSRMLNCSVFSAFNRITAHDVLIKKSNTELSWNEILCHKELQIISHIKLIPKLNEILRHKGNFMFVVDKPHGNSLAVNSAIEKQELPSAIQLLSGLLEGVVQLERAVAKLMIVPEWVYFHRNSLKLIHYEPFLAKEASGQKKYTFTHETEANGLNPEGSQQEQSDILPEQYRKTLVFHLGLIAYRLLTGKKEERVNSKEEYEGYVSTMREHCERQILKATSDQRLASFVGKMISSNRFEVPELQQVSNYFQNQARLLQAHKPNKELTLEVELQKIHLNSNKPPVEKYRRARNCCKREPQSIPAINHVNPVNPVNSSQLKKMGLVSQRQMSCAKESKLMLPYLSIKNSYHLSRERNLSCINRHKPELTTTSRKVRKREHIKSLGYFQQDRDLS